MSFRTLVFTIALAPGLLLGQLNSNTVTATASQNSSSQPDQAIFNVVVSTIVNAVTNLGVDDAVKAVADVGISVANLVGVTFQSNPPALNPPAPLTVQWTFQLPGALSMQKQTTASLVALQQKIAQANNGLSLSFSVAGLQSSGQQMQSCNYSTLIANAQAQAQQLASAAGSAAGRITGISGSTSNGVGNCSATVTFGLGYIGNPGPHAISITASRSATALPDQILISISVTSGITWSLEDISNIIKQAGVVGASFSNVYTATFDNQGHPNPSLQWSYTLTTPLPTLRNTIAQLLAAVTALSKQKLGIGLSFSTGGLQTSPQAQPVCLQATLVADATAQAQALAAAAGVSAGQVTALSSVTLATVPLVANRVLATNGIFDPLGGSGGGYAGFLLGVVQYSAPPPATTCSLFMQFQLY